MACGSGSGGGVGGRWRRWRRRNLGLLCTAPYLDNAVLDLLPHQVEWVVDVPHGGRPGDGVGSGWGRKRVRMSGAGVSGWEGCHGWYHTGGMGVGVCASRQILGR